MAWDVEGMEEFEAWYAGLDEAAQQSVMAAIDVLAEEGTALRFPRSSGINGSRHRHMRELRIKHQGKQFRVLYAFDPRRTAILLIGGDKTGQDRWYEQYVPQADRIYDEYISELAKEGLLYRSRQ